MYIKYTHAPHKTLAYTAQPVIFDPIITWGNLDIGISHS